MDTPSRKPRRLGQCTPDAAVKDKFFLKLYLGMNSAGKRIYHAEVFYGKRKDAEQRLREIHNRHLAGDALKPSKDTFGAFADEWLTSKKLSVEHNTIRDYESIIRFYIKPTLGTTLLSRVTDHEIERMYVELSEKGLSRSTIKHVHVVLAMILKLAVIRKKIAASPMISVSIPKDDRSEAEQIKSMTAAQAIKFMHFAKGDPFEVFFNTSFEAGTRPGETLGLKWDDVEFTKGAILIRRNIYFVGAGEWKVKEPKTKRGRRVIPISPRLLEMLSGHRRAQLERRIKAGRLWEDHGFVFSNEIGQPLNQRQAYYAFKEIARAAGLPPHFSPYSCRHTMATLLIESRESLKAVSERLGHSDIAITLENYNHVLPGTQEGLTSKIDELLNADSA